MEDICHNPINDVTAAAGDEMNEHEEDQQQQQLNKN
jgi:hypothetical protein